MLRMDRSRSEGSRSEGSPPRCDDQDHRAVFLYLRLAQAARVRARIMRVLGANQVSHLRADDEGWTMVICPECALTATTSESGTPLANPLSDVRRPAREGCCADLDGGKGRSPGDCGKT